METMVILFVWCMAMGGIGFLIGEIGGKGNGAFGVMFGVLLGPIGLIITAVLPKSGANEKADPPAKASEESARIAKLEAELAAIKRAAGERKKATNRNPPGGEIDERGIPTYKL